MPKPKKQSPLHSLELTGLGQREPFPCYDEIADVAALRDSQTVLDGLRGLDWSFTEDDTSFLTHDLHPYPAKFIPQIPGHLIARLSLRGEMVVDPFGGSGTTALEAVRLGRRAISLDANPLGTLIGQVKIARLDTEAVIDLQAITSSLRTRLGVVRLGTEPLCTTYADFIPDIPNRQKWFGDTACGELALIRACIADVQSDVARQVCLIALSRSILKASYQDSETRYSSRPRDIPPGQTVQEFLSHLDRTVYEVSQTEPELRYGIAHFRTADARDLGQTLPEASADLLVTSPPYANAWDYHLYHRFRLLWLGFEPRELASVEIGSHLRHQRQGSTFDDYLEEMRPVLAGGFRALRGGRYAAFVVGDAIFGGEVFDGAEGIGSIAADAGFEHVGTIERPIHDKKRSVVRAGQRATSEKIVILRKPASLSAIALLAPPYKLWPYEQDLRRRETAGLLGEDICADAVQHVKCDPYRVPAARRLAFTHTIGHSSTCSEKTWQAILENGFAANPSARKDPHYVTHGLHPYKGKFYPQLAKGLLNLSGVGPGRLVLDPFCGSGTTLLEGYLSGLSAVGIDMHPLAVKIANAKVGILAVDPDLLTSAVKVLSSKLDAAPSQISVETEQMHGGAIDEVYRWFPEPVVAKLNWLLRAIRSVSAGSVRDFLEVVLSSIIRDVSQQEPRDLRIRRRHVEIEDADVFGLFEERLSLQYQRIERFWAVRGHCPHRLMEARAICGDSRSSETTSSNGVSDGSVDIVLTSPPYATALPYIDTDRLSLLVLFGMASGERRPLEHDLVGSREILNSERTEFERLLAGTGTGLPSAVSAFILDLFERIDSGDHGFRRRNAPALLVRFFQDMQSVLGTCLRSLTSGGDAMFVIGDNRMSVDGMSEVIPTTRLVEEVALAGGFELVERLPITVTTDNSIHNRNAIKENVVLRLRRP